METEVYGQLVTRNFWIQQLITFYKIFYCILSGVIGIILNKMLTARLLPIKSLLSTSSQTTTIQQSTSNNSSSNRLVGNRIVGNNQETDHISATQINGTDHFKVQSNIINNGKSNNTISRNILLKKYKNSNNIIENDVIDNKTDNFLTPSFCNIKRMTEIYCSEAERLKTFEAWPLDFIDKEILAKTGFFFTGDDDKVKCFFCEVEIGRWEPSDNPISEHTRWSPNCPLMRRRTTNNIAIDPESLNTILPPVSYDVCGASEYLEVRPNAYAEGSISSSSPIGSPINSLPSTPNSVTAITNTNFLYPDHPEYAIELSRLRSFGEWPRNMKQKPEQLSEAGFFYTGVGDRVICFSCGGGLKDWDENDDPWEQHALWLGNCHYLKLIKGTSYIQSVAEKFKTVEEESKELETNESENQEEEQTQNNSNNNNIEEISNIASTSSTSPSLLVRSAASSSSSSGNGETLQNNNKNSNSTNNNKLRHSENSCSTSNNSNEITSCCSDEENCSLSGSESISSVNSNSSKEAETVCKQPKLDCHHHHISRNLQSKKSITISEEKLCKICYAAEYNTAFLPCGHVVACAKCASSVTKCPMCRKPFIDVMRVYFS